MMRTVESTMPRLLGGMGSRLYIGFAVVLCLLAGLAAVAVPRVNEIAGSLATVNDVNSVKQRFAINFRGSVHDRAISLRDVVLVGTEQERRAALDEIRRLEGFYAESAQRLDAIMAAGREVTPDETRILASIKETEARTMPMIRQVIDARMAGDAERAHALLMDQARPAFVEWLARINRFIDLQEEKNRLIATRARSVADGFQTLLLAVVAAGIAIGAGVAFWATRAVAPLHALAGTMRRMAEGDLTGAVPGRGRGDEVGAMAEAVEVFRMQGEEARRLRASQEAEREAARQAQSAALRGLADSLESQVSTVVEGIASAAAELSDAAGALVGNAQDTTRRAATVTAASGTANGDVDAVAAAAEQLTASVTEISRQVAESARFAASAVEQSSRTDGTVANLTDAAARIGEVTRLIGDIAAQTNLLALNATIEAARAGDAGKGFAVVASEVKQLASQTAKATESISAQIAAMQAATADATRDLGTIRESIGRISEVTSAIAAAVEEQGAATHDIAQSVQRAAGATREIAGAIEGVSTAAGSTSGAADRVQSTSERLAGQADRLRRQVGDFLRQVRAA
jgi:methyl-accepting chemotaxis protein